MNEVQLTDEVIKNFTYAEMKPDSEDDLFWDVMYTFTCDNCKKFFKTTSRYQQAEHLVMQLKLHLMQCAVYKSYLLNTRKVNMVL